MTLEELLSIKDVDSNSLDGGVQTEKELLAKIKEEYLKKLIRDSQIPRTKAAVFGTRG
jgi:hypothetical protein